MKERRMQILEDGTIIPCGFCNHHHTVLPQKVVQTAEERTKEILEILQVMKCGYTDEGRHDKAIMCGLCQVAIEMKYGL